VGARGDLGGYIAEPRWSPESGVRGSVTVNQSPVEQFSTYLQQIVGAFGTPAHLLLLVQPVIHQMIHY
jgi:hypothetical protein